MGLRVTLLPDDLSCRRPTLLCALVPLLALLAGCSDESADTEAETDATSHRGADARRPTPPDVAPFEADAAPTADAAFEPPDVPAPDARPADADLPGPPPPDAAPEVSPPDAAPPTPDAGLVGPPTARGCFAAQLPSGGQPLVDYDAWGPRIGTHCKGTNHQDIQGVQRVVFVGDSVTVGTPPTPEQAWYRNLIAQALAAEWGLAAPQWPWSGADVINGVGAQQDSGDFAVCAKWGARTDDIYRPPHEQLQTCLPEEEREKTTLVIMTVGGNDIFSWAQDLVAGEDPAALRLAAEQAVADLEEAVRWLTDDPARFPGGIYLVFANTFEFTDQDSGRDLATCPGADLIGMDRALVDPAFQELSTWMMGEYMRIAVETGTDMAFMGEHFCGHGHMREEPAGRCYRGPATELWFDITCLHPSAEGHAGLADLFLSVIRE